MYKKTDTHRIRNTPLVVFLISTCPFTAARKIEHLARVKNRYLM